MSITYSRYEAIRQRIFKLYNILQNRVYKVGVTPAMTMDMDELRDRELITRDDVLGDHLFFEEYQFRDMTIPNIMDILQYLQSNEEIPFQDANTAVIEIYESIQEYIQLFVEIAMSAPEFRTPPLDELRRLESVAYLIFPTYRKVKKYHAIKDMYRSKKEVNDMATSFNALAGLFGITSGEQGPGKDNIVFISHLDHWLGNSAPHYVDVKAIQQLQSPQTMTDSLFSSTEAPTQFPEWTFNRG